MKNTLIYPAGMTAACQIAGSLLERQGFSITDHPMPEITHVLLDVPLRQKDTAKLLSMLPEHITVVGGNLVQPFFQNCKIWDFLEDPYYLAQNAAITAECALQVAFPKLHTTIRELPVLILGWGRIGKCLAQLLRSMGADVTVTARKPEDLAMIRALGYRDANYESVDTILLNSRLLYNTVPHSVLDSAMLSLCRNTIKIELSSINALEGNDVITARGLPGTYAPEASGKLIADTFVRFWKEERS